MKILKIVLNGAGRGESVGLYIYTPPVPFYSSLQLSQFYSLTQASVGWYMFL